MTATEHAKATLAANGIKLDPDATADGILYLASLVEKARTKRTRTQFTAELLATADKLHTIDKLSVRQIAIKLHCDRHALKWNMVDAGYTVRDKKASQRARRDLEAKGGVELNLTKGDVMEWNSHELFRNGGK